MLDAKWKYAGVVLETDSGDTESFHSRKERSGYTVGVFRSKVPYEAYHNLTFTQVMEKLAEFIGGGK